MYVVNSYLHVLKNIDSSWGDSTSSSSSRNSKRSWRRKRSRTSSRSSKTSAGTSHKYSSSSESGLFSEELVNSGYYGDDEVDRCRCPKCVLAVEQARKPRQDVTAEYDIISVDLSACSTPKRDTKLDFIPRVQQPNFEEYIVIPSTKEEFFAENFAHSTPVEKNGTSRLNDVNESRNGSSRNVCTRNNLTSDEGSESSVPKATLQRAISKSRRSCWWRDNIVWQLQQRNEAQTNNFIQFQTDGQKCRPKIRINKELADYLNKSPTTAVSTAACVAIEVDPIEKSELVLAIRTHGAICDETQGDTRLRSGGIAHLATTYLKNQRTIVEEKLLESDESDWTGCERSRMQGRGGKREISGSRRWRESIVNQLQMRNFLECKYFTDAIVRRSMSQLSISQDVAPPRGDLADYDIITDDEVSSLDSRSTLINSSHSTSQGYYSSPIHRRRFSFRRGRHR